MALFEKETKKSIIAGPCALESRHQLKEAIDCVKKCDLSVLRASLWKPRTRPGWDGLGKAGINMLLEESFAEGLIPATEVIIAKHVEWIVEALKSIDPKAKILLWLGSRNQNHFELAEMVNILLAGPEGIYLMFKNQMWQDEAHWLGIADHLIAQGFPKERLLSCHRGFAPCQIDNPHKLRNPPDFEMAMKVKSQLELPMYFDPSHSGGSVANVFLMTEMAMKYSFDGFLIEFHSCPIKALTDSKQQLNPEQLQKLVKFIEKKSLQSVGKAFSECL